MKKKHNYFFDFLIISFLIFIALYIALESGYYESKISKKAILTEESISQFETDVKEGKEIDINDYIVKDYIDYSSPVSKLGNSISRKIEEFMSKDMNNFFNFLGNLF